ncbi:flavodoxin family protein [Isachenkonia alkalipeptolytica]|nr:flavodoxin family protein [Isachenkonia alkalipeptolytica]
MKVLAILGSPIRRRNNEFLLNKVIQGLEDHIPKDETVEVDFVSVQSLKVSPCIACDRCTRIKGCVFQDDMSYLYKAFNDSDVILFSSPLYFNSVSAQAKAIIDRCQAIFSSKYVLKDPMIDRNRKRLGLFISTAGVDMNDDTELFKGTLPVMDLFFRSINTEYVGNLFIGNVDRVKTSDNPEASHAAREWGRRLVNSYSNPASSQN